MQLDAGALLLRPDDVRRYWPDDRNPKVNDLLNLADNFRLSHSAALIKIQKSPASRSYTPCANR